VRNPADGCLLVIAAAMILWMLFIIACVNGGKLL
jgi:hypothetical protein